MFDSPVAIWRFVCVHRRNKIATTIELLLIDKNTIKQKKTRLFLCIWKSTGIKYSTNHYQKWQYGAIVHPPADPLTSVSIPKVICVRDLCEEWTYGPRKIISESASTVCGDGEFFGLGRPAVLARRMCGEWCHRAKKHLPYRHSFIRTDLWWFSPLNRTSLFVILSYIFFCTAGLVKLWSFGGIGLTSDTCKPAHSRNQNGIRKHCHRFDESLSRRFHRKPGQETT